MVLLLLLYSSTETQRMDYGDKDLMYEPTAVYGVVLFVEPSGRMGRPHC